VTNEPQLTVFYNGACPICRREIAHYRRLAQDTGAPLAWCDVASDAEALAAHGIGGDAAVRRLHAVDADGRLLVGIDAFAAVWQRLPRWVWLARVLRWRSARWLMAQLYDRIAAPVLAAAHRRRTSRGGALANGPPRR
jgi:predicted DCC family thiol-disulfide oxidoreductase YuxK